MRAALAILAALGVVLLVFAVFIAAREWRSELKRREQARRQIEPAPAVRRWPQPEGAPPGVPPGVAPDLLGGLFGIIAAEDGLGLNFHHIGGFELPFEMAALLAVPIVELTAEQRAERVRARRAAVREVAAEHGRLAGVEAYVGLASRNTSDSQNVHDTGVLTCLKGIVGRLRADQAGRALPNISEIVNHFRRNGPALSGGRPERVADVEAVIERTQAGERVEALGATDDECLRRVWLRAADPRNAAKRDTIRQALFDVLAECWESKFGSPNERSIVCVNGRTAQILSTLVLNDWDPRNWEVKKLEQIRNDIFAKAAGVIRAEAEAAVASGDPGAQAAGRQYLAQTTEELHRANERPPAAADAERLAGRMRAAIDAMVDDYMQQLGGALPSTTAEAIKEEARAAVE